MMFKAIRVSLFLVGNGKLGAQGATRGESAQLLYLIAYIRFPYAECTAARGFQGGGRARLLLGSSGRPLLLAVGGLAGDREARGRSRLVSARAASGRRPPDRRRGGPGRTRRRDPRPDRGGRRGGLG